MDAIFEFAREELERIGVPGAAVAIVHGGDEHAAGYGVTSVEHPLDVTPDTLFQIGSITKTMTGTVVLRLVERGDLDLDAPLRTYLPELRMSGAGVAERLTMRHLLTHTGGWIGDYFDDLGWGDDALAQMVERVADLAQVTPLGEIWSYNNSGFYLAGRAIEVVTGTTYEEAVQEHVFDPLGMEMSYFFPDDVMTHRFAAGHLRGDNGPRVARPWPLPRAAHAAGGVTSTVVDLLKYARPHLADGAPVLGRETVALMQMPVVSLGGLGADDIGLTWMLRTRSGRKIVSHGGATNGQQALLTLVPEERLAVAVLTNHARGGELAYNVTRRALERLAQIDDPDPEPLAKPREDLEPYVGRYSAPMTDVELSFGERPGRLTMTITPKGGFPKPDSPPFPAPPPAPLAFYADERVVVPEGELKGARGDFLRGPDGEISWFRTGGRVHARA